MTERPGPLSISPTFWGIILLAAALAALTGCEEEPEWAPEASGPSPRTVPLPAESPVMQFRLEREGRIYGQNAQGWLICWDQETGQVVWEVQTDALARIPGIQGEDLVLVTWSGRLDVREKSSGHRRWVQTVEDLPLMNWDRYGSFYRVTDLRGRLVLLDAAQGYVVLDRPAPEPFRLVRVERWTEDHPWILDVVQKKSPAAEPASYPAVAEDLVDWLKARGRGPEDLLYFPPEQDLVGLVGAREENPVLFTAWKAGVYTFSSPSLHQIPVKISLKDFAGAEMDSNLGYGEIRPEVSWKLKKGEPVLLDLVLINPEFTGQDVMLQVQVK